MLGDSNSIRSNSELKALAREQLKGKWGTVLLLCLVFGIITGLLGSIPHIGPVISIIISGPFTLGLISCFMKLIRKEYFKFENLFDGFQNLGSAIILQILIGIFVFLWSLLLIIPGIIAIYRYAMSFYILYDNPDIGASEALNKSKEMMKGYKWKLFCLHFSFIGWVILSVLTLGIGFLWLTPYINTSNANFYQNLKDSSLDSSTLQ
ncbi:DUF975 family protein [Clostridium sp. WILCCON 0269]|uniref:DUF975 family protein n=1 Tax=Candidatus Clostridium eludens TaxID=3381663 RepID=A0ABW8SGF2_9CLOT